MELPPSFGSWVRLRRRALDLTQDALAHAVGCSVVTIRKLEAEERRPSRQIAERLADCLQIAASQRAAFIGLARAESVSDAPQPSALPPEVPPQRPRSNLPVPLTRLIGRKPELAALRSALLRGDTRLLTLVGPPGIGKTRLAVQAASELRDAFADGVYFVALAAIRHPTLVPGAIALALGVQESGGQPLHERLHAYLYAKRILLLLDNFEQIVEAAPSVVELLEHAVGVKALVTSRVALRVRGEQVMPVTPLPLPEHAGAPTLQELARNPAVVLFVERARAAQPAFGLTTTNARAIVEVCTQLDGLPLAIELMAARARLLPPEELRARLDQRLTLLGDGPRDLPVRHQSLRAALASSYDLLDADAQALFRRVGVFADGWTLEAAEALHQALRSTEQGSGVPRDPQHSQSVIVMLTTLVEHSLVMQRPLADRAPRFALLETIREYAAEQLAADGETDAARRAHARYFLQLAERARPELHSPQQVAWLDHLEAEHANLRAALEWALYSETTAVALRLAGALGWFWYVRGYSSEGRRWLDRVLAASMPEGASAPDAAAAPDRADLLATALQVAGHLALFQGDFAHARMRLEASAAIWRALMQTTPGPSVQQGLAFALTFLFLTVQFQGDDTARRALLAEYVALSTTLSDPRSQALLRFNLGRSALLQFGDYQTARPHLEQALALFRELGDLWYLAQAVIDLGLVALYQEAYALAAAHYGEGLALAQTLRDRTLVALALNNLGEVARCQDQVEQAYQLYRESLALHQELGNQSEAPRLLHNLGYLALRQDDRAQASACFHESLRRFQHLGMTRGVAEALAGCAAVATGAGRFADAARLWGAAEALHRAEGTPVWPADRREHLRYQALAAPQIDPQVWEVAWQQGHTNPLAVVELLAGELA